MRRHTFLKCCKCHQVFRRLTWMQRICPVCREKKKEKDLEKYSGYKCKKSLFFESVKKRDGNCCKICGKSEKDKPIDFKKGFLNVHHWDMDTENNSLNNLVTLCDNCHHKLHRYLYSYKNH